jgi:hypothetical protein
MVGDIAKGLRPLRQRLPGQYIILRNVGVFHGWISTD